MQYSDDLRRKLIEAYEAGRGTQAALADLFGVSLGWVQKVLRRWRATGQAEAASFRHGPLPSLLPSRLLRVAQQHPDATLAELGRRLKVSPSTVCRGLQHLGLPRKKRHSTPASVTRRASSGGEPSGGGCAAAGTRGG